MSPATTARRTASSSTEEGGSAPRSPRQAARREATRAEILDAAWTIVQREGLAALSLRDLGAQVGMRAQSIYSYFGSKNDIYDLMFRQGYEQMLDEVVVEVADTELPGFLVTARKGALDYFDFCVADTVRYQLLFQRTIPGFEPSPASYAVAVDAYDRTVGQLRCFPGTTDADLDLWTALLSGLVSQQVANEPGGTRWRDLVPGTIELLLANIAERRST
ncbi:MAG: TetR/AcrR family transcriptional regulator [Actinomycetes bacterium]